MLPPLVRITSFLTASLAWLSQNQDAFFNHFQADRVLPKRFIDLFL
jgi:hypothetical protein